MNMTSSFTPRRFAANASRSGRNLPLFRLLTLAVALAGTPSPAQTITSAVPGLISYQSKVSNANGTLVGSGTPVNRIVVFRIWSHTSNSTVNDLVYSEQQTVTISEGEFSVLIGQGTAVGGSPLGYDEVPKGPSTVTVGSLNVFGGATRYLGVTIDDGNGSIANDPEISPRQQLVSSAYAFRAKYAEALGSNGASTLVANDSGYVGIGTNAPSARLHLAGALKIDGTNTIELGAGVPKEGNAGKIGYQVFSTDGLDIVGAGVDVNRRVRFFAEGGTSFNGAVGIGVTTPGAAGGPWAKSLLSVNGNIALRGDGTGASSWHNQRLLFGGDGTGYVLSIASVNNAGTLNPDIMTVSDLGRVGLGSTSPAARLDVNGAIMVNSGFSNNAARPAVGAARVAGEIGAYGSGGTTQDDGFLRLSAGGGTNANTKSFIDLTGYSTVADMHMNLRFGTAGAERMRIDPNGNVGINTSSPAAPFHVKGVGTSASVTAQFDWSGSGNNSHVHYGSTGDIYWRSGVSSGKIVLQDSGGNVAIGHANPYRARLDVHGSVNLGNIGYVYYNSGPGWGHATANPGFGIFASSVIGTSAEFIIYSDERMKVVEGRSDGPADLRTLMQVEVTDYRYKDKIVKGDTPQKKVLGQQLERVFPQAVKRTTDVVPDIYDMAAIQDGWIALTTDLKSGERVKLVTDDGEKLCEVSAVEPGRFQVNVPLKGERVFVYGREVKDFRTVDYDAIAMLNVSATQEIKREKDAEVAALRAQNAALTARVAELEAKDRARDTKLAAIEKLLSSERTVMARPASARAAAGEQE